MSQIRYIYNVLVDKKTLSIWQKFDPYDTEGHVYFDFIQNIEAKF